jgi:hypothetical protein
VLRMTGYAPVIFNGFLGVVKGLHEKVFDARSKLKREQTIDNPIRAVTYYSFVYSVLRDRCAA